MSFRKYLFYFGYNGTRFRGVQKDKKLGSKDNCIVNHLEEGLRKLRPFNDPVVYVSSRTDAGVHALCSAFHCELNLRNSKQRIRKSLRHLTLEERLTYYLNKYFRENSLEIRIHHVLPVPAGFHCRFCAVKRTYIYRLAYYHGPKTIADSTVLPIFELNKCQIVSGQFDVEAVKKACQIIEKGSDFRFFTKIPRKFKNLVKTERTLEECKIIEGSSLVNPIYDNRYKDIDFLDVIVSSRAFLYNQIRRIVAVLIAVGQGHIDLQFVEDCFVDPEKTFHSTMKLANSCGLYLANVTYPPEAFLEETYERREFKEEAEGIEEDLEK